MPAHALSLNQIQSPGMDMAMVAILAMDILDTTDTDLAMLDMDLDMDITWAKDQLTPNQKQIPNHGTTDTVDWDTLDWDTVDWDTLMEHIHTLLPAIITWVKDLLIPNQRLNHGILDTTHMAMDMHLETIMVTVTASVDTTDMDIFMESRVVNFF